MCVRGHVCVLEVMHLCVRGHVCVLGVLILPLPTIFQLDFVMVPTVVFFSFYYFILFFYIIFKYFMDLKVSWTGRLRNSIKTLVILNDKDVLEIKIINYIAQDLY
jgi:hypothetical protein